MATSISIVAEALQWEASEYKRRYDEIHRARERELKEARDNFKPNSKMLLEKEEQIKNTCDSSLTKLRVGAADRALQDVEELRKQELQRVQTVNEPLLAKIRAISNIPMTTLELKAFAAKIGARGDYWASRMLSDICERNGIDSTEICLESSYDTKMIVLDQLVGQLDKILKYYGTKDIEERAYVKYAYLNDTIVERAKQMFNGRIDKLSDSQKADRAFLTVSVQQTDISKGVAIANVLRNARGETRNLILCRLAEDNSISEAAAEFSGHWEEIASFKNGLAREYRDAEKVMENIRRLKDKTVIEQTAAGMEENSFFGDMFEKEQKTNLALYEVLNGESEGGTAE